MNAIQSGSLLSAIGRNGSAVLGASVVLGLAWPALAQAARPLMPLSVLILLFGAMMKVDRAALSSIMSAPAGVAAALLWTTLGVPLVGCAILAVLQPPAGLREGLVLYVLAPPVGSAAALAAMLGLIPSLALLSTLAATLVSPVLLPFLAFQMLGTSVIASPWPLVVGLGSITGLAALAAILTRRLLGAAVATMPNAMTGIAVSGLVLLALGTMQGMQDRILADPSAAAGAFAIAFASNLALQLLGAVVFARAGRAFALTVGLVSGNRNAALVWVASTTAIVGRPDIEMTIAMTCVTVFILPLLIGWLQAVRRSPRALSPSVPATVDRG